MLLQVTPKRSDFSHAWITSELQSGVWAQLGRAACSKSLTQLLHFNVNERIPFLARSHGQEQDLVLFDECVSPSRAVSRRASSLSREHRTTRQPSLSRQVREQDNERLRRMTRPVSGTRFQPFYLLLVKSKSLSPAHTQGATQGHGNPDAGIIGGHLRDTCHSDITVVHFRNHFAWGNNKISLWRPVQRLWHQSRVYVPLDQSQNREDSPSSRSLCQTAVLSSTLY